MVSFNTMGQANRQKKTLIIPDGKVGLIGYGSLMSKKSMETTLGRIYTEDYMMVHLTGFERKWTFSRPNDGKFRPQSYYLNLADTIYPKYTIALNIERANDKYINACLFIIDESDLEAFDTREYGYERLNVTDKINELNVKGTVYVYSALPEFNRIVTNDPEENTIAEQYIKIVEDGFKDNQDFKDEFFKTTIPYNRAIVKYMNRKTLK
jgi:hypothetical protein